MRLAPAACAASRVLLPTPAACAHSVTAGTLRVLTARGVAYRHDPRDAEAARSERFDEPAVLPPGTWRLPAGAYAGDTCGPT